jgi:hypothetical protein
MERMVRGKIDAGVRPGGGALAWCVFSYFRASGVSSPNDEPLLFRQKWPKPLTPRLALLEERAANFFKERTNSPGSDKVR